MAAWIERSNQSILKEINLEYSLEGLLLKLQYFGQLMWRADLLEKALMLGKSEEKRRRGWQDDMVGWHHWLNEHEFKQAQGDSGQGSLMCCSPWGHKESDTTEQLNNNMWRHQEVIFLRNSEYCLISLTVSHVMAGAGLSKTASLTILTPLWESVELSWETRWWGPLSFWRYSQCWSLFK